MPLCVICVTVVTHVWSFIFSSLSKVDWIQCYQGFTVIFLLSEAPRKFGRHVLMLKSCCSYEWLAWFPVATMTFFGGLPILKIDDKGLLRFCYHSEGERLPVTTPLFYGQNFFYASTDNCSTNCWCQNVTYSNSWTWSRLWRTAFAAFPVFIYSSLNKQNYFFSASLFISYCALLLWPNVVKGCWKS